MNVLGPRQISLPTPDLNMMSPGQALMRLGKVATRHKTAITLSIVFFLALAVGYLLITPKEYLASTEMLIDPRRSGQFTSDSNSQSGAVPQVDSAVVESEGEVLKSEEIAKAVIKKLDLTNSPTFTVPTGVAAIANWVESEVMPSGEPDSALKIEREVVRQFADRLTVKRVGVSYLFDIGFLSRDPQEAANVANAVAEAYVTADLDAKSAVIGRATGWMQDRINQLGDQATAAEQAVADYQRKNNIVNTGGRLLDEQQTSELSSQLSLARAATSEAKAKLDRIEQAARGSVPDMSVGDALHNEVIIKLRDTYADMAKRDADLQARLGRNHDAVKRVEADMRNVNASIVDELNRIGESYRSDYRVALARQQGLQQQLQDAIMQTQIGASAGVRLRQLTSAATSYRALYDVFLQKFAEAAQLQTFPITETRVVTVATPPLKKTQPKTLITLLGGAIAGTMVGMGFGWLKENTDKTLRNRQQTETILDISYIASVPRLVARRQGDARSFYRETMLHPLSAFSEAIRQIRVHIDVISADTRLQVIGFTSALPGEGKSTIASNLAHQLARSGASVILLDCDLRQSNLTTLFPHDNAGLLEVLTGRATVEQATIVDAESSLRILPSIGYHDRADSSDLISSRKMQALLQKLREDYQFIIADLPPLLPVIDTKAAAGLFDGFVFVAQWGDTSVETIVDALQTSGAVHSRIVGIVLNKVDARIVEKTLGGYGRESRRLLT